MHHLAISGGDRKVAPQAHIRWPILNAEDKAAVLQVLERGVLSGPFAPEVRALEAEFAEYIGSKYCLATNSGTAALHMALAAAGVGPGDEVIVPAFTFVATALAVLHQNAIPVFVDIEPTDAGQTRLGLDPRLVEAAITPRTKAIIPVHIHGIPCDMDAILEIAQKHNLCVIEDACQAHGAKYKGKQVGSMGHFGAFSLQSSKNLACGEGGLLVTNDRELFERASRTRMFGENIKPTHSTDYSLDRPLDSNRAYDSVTMGWMYRTNEMSAALARSQLKRLEFWNASARKNAEILSQHLAKLPGITPPCVPVKSVGVFHKYRVLFDIKEVRNRIGKPVEARVVRDALVQALKAEGVDAVLWQTQPVPGQGLFRDKVGFGKGCPWDHGSPVNYDLGQFPETNRMLDSSLCLFSHTYPIGAQPPALCEAYGEAFAKVWNHLDEVMSAAGTQK